MYVLGLDVGGHAAKGGLFTADDEGRLTLIGRAQRTYALVARDPSLAKQYVPAANRIADTLLLGVTLIQNTGIPGVDAVGLATTGVLERTTGVMLDDFSPAYMGTAWPRLLRQAFEVAAPLRLHVVNDSKAAAWAEYIAEREAAPDAPVPPVFCGMVVASGIGVGIILDGALFHGGGNPSGEVGALLAAGLHPLEGDEPPDIETVAASPGLLRYALHAARAAGREPSRYGTIADLNRRLAAGDPVANDAAARAALGLSQAVTALVNILSPNRLIFSGGAIEHLATYYERMEQLVRASARQPALAHLTMRLSTLKGDGGILGAAHLALTQPVDYPE